MYAAIPQLAATRATGVYGVQLAIKHFKYIYFNSPEVVEDLQSSTKMHEMMVKDISRIADINSDSRPACASSMKATLKLPSYSFIYENSPEFTCPSFKRKAIFHVK